MSIEEIPKAYKYTCDICGDTHIQENANGHYANSRPSRWAKLRFERDAVVYKGYAVADASIALQLFVERLLCPRCGEIVAAKINEAAVTRKD